VLVLYLPDGIRILCPWRAPLTPGASSTKFEDDIFSSEAATGADKVDRMVRKGDLFYLVTERSELEIYVAIVGLYVYGLL